MTAPSGRWVALMPLRGGSRGIPGKNLRRMAGRPMFAWALEQAVASGIFDEVCVSSDSAPIRDRADALFGGAVTVLDRSAAGASDTAASEHVMLEVAARVAFDVMALVQATSPLTRAEDFVAARHRFEREALDSLVTAVPFRRFLWSAAGVPLNYDPAARPRRQDMTPALVENGAFYFTRRRVLLEQGSRLGGHTGVHPMAEDTLVEVDEPADWHTAERVLQRRLGVELGLVKVLAVDVDGTLTDGGMYYSGCGEQLKKFDTRDARGLAKVAASGIRVCVITAEDSRAVAARMRRLGIVDYFPGVTDKWALLQELLRSAGLEPGEAAYIGDDDGDVMAMRSVGWSFCPADATLAARTCAGYVCDARGGAGAVREVCELLCHGHSSA